MFEQHPGGLGCTCGIALSGAYSAHLDIYLWHRSHCESGPMRAARMYYRRWTGIIRPHQHTATVPCSAVLSLRLRPRARILEELEPWPGPSFGDADIPGAPWQLPAQETPAEM
jgi:hypothetical protein